MTAAHLHALPRSRDTHVPTAAVHTPAFVLQPLLRAMLSQSAAARPNAAAFAGCQWFAEDMLLRCLKFLDSILQRDSGQKVRVAAASRHCSCRRLPLQTLG